jgi:hypothetical protein
MDDKRETLKAVAFLLFAAVVSFFIGSRCIP